MLEKSVHSNWVDLPEKFQNVQICALKNYSRKVESTNKPRAYGQARKGNSILSFLFTCDPPLCDWSGSLDDNAAIFLPILTLIYRVITGSQKI